MHYNIILGKIFKSIPSYFLNLFFFYLISKNSHILDSILPPNCQGHDINSFLFAFVSYLLLNICAHQNVVSRYSHILRYLYQLGNSWWSHKAILGSSCQQGNDRLWQLPSEQCLGFQAFGKQMDNFMPLASCHFSFVYFHDFPSILFLRKSLQKSLIHVNSQDLVLSHPAFPSFCQSLLLCYFWEHMFTPIQRTEKFWILSRCYRFEKICLSIYTHIYMQENQLTNSTAS